MVKSLRLVWVGRLTSNSDDNWKAISNFYFDTGGLPFLLPLFQRELLDYFQELAKFSEYDKNNDPILWNNRRIRIERNGVFWKQWYDQGVTFNSALINSNGKFLTPSKNFKINLKLKLAICSIFQLIAAIPPDLKRKAFAWKIEQQSEFRCKNYYSLFIEKLVSEPSAVRTWKKAFQKFLIRVIVL